MWKSMFLAIGIFLILFGAQCLGVATFKLRIYEDQPAASMLDIIPGPVPQKTFSPAPWAPWSLMATGAIVCLYSFTIPKRMSGG